MKKSVFIYIILPLLILSCTKHEVIPIQQTNSPEFNAELTFGGETKRFVAGEDECVLTPLTTKDYGIFRMQTIFNKGNEQLFFSINDGDFQNNISFQDKLKAIASNGLKFSNFNSIALAYSLDSIKQFLGGDDVDLYINNQLLESDNYTFPSSGIYTLDVVKVIDGKSFKISNDWYVGFKNPFGNLTFDYNTTSHQLTANIVNESTTKIAVKWYLNDVLTSEENTLISNDNLTATTKIKAVVSYQGVSKSFEGLIDLNQATNQVDDIKKYSYLLQNGENPDDLRIRLKLVQDNQTWLVVPNNDGYFSIKDIHFYKKMDGKDIYLLEGETSDILMRNTSTNEEKTARLKIKGGFEFPY